MQQAPDFNALPPLCLQLIAKQMDQETRRAFRAVCQQAHTAANLSTTALSMYTPPLKTLPSGEVLAMSRAEERAHKALQPTSIPASLIRKLPNLLKIDLRGVTTLVHWPEALPPNLQHLDISYTGLKKNPQGCSLSALSTCAANLRTLQLYALDMGPAGAATLAPCLRQMHQLENLVLDNNSLKSEGMIALAPAISTLTNLQTLSLGNNGLDSEDMGCLVAAMVSPLTNLRQLMVSGGTNYLCCVELVKAVQGLRQMEVMDVWDVVEYPDDFVPLIAETLRHTTKLRSLYVNTDSLAAEEVADLASSIQRLTCLETLDFACEEDCEPPEDAAPVPAMVAPLRQLTHLSLNGSPLGPSGARLLARSLRNLTMLSELELKWCNLQSEGVVALAPTLKHLKKLWSLELTGNDIADRGAQVLWRTVQQLTTLHVLNLLDNPISRGAAFALVLLTRQMPNLEFVDVDEDVYVP